ncbi:hypothetical protein COU93_00690 [Candidatus Shapirobacteria bacterium CG10_big_fil_rev_8_21_14_0_10_36_6]|uniref:AB hydrolase-1 domain-containing protein n=2 Tax=Candidatus Shapironibacteriota TaxID=1752721 RepID=A0A2M7LJU2_9BACT|nr:MAG: hypothetical protein COZ41_00285 [Candidatus Shapirobacteria bacterium CG_4_10_14_3_um_filter_35_13]PJE67086.1 MAG: hypothetical protein COU93_00690 [Candidatus Shapirobacteria bacterium CG10_big_fil_rev_8_21_14_0_10_36_6]
MWTSVEKFVYPIVIIVLNKCYSRNMKRVVIINGVGVGIDSEHFLVKVFVQKEYEVLIINLLDDTVVINNLDIKFVPDVIVGFSLGGMVAIKLIYQYPSAKLVLLATGSRIFPSRHIFRIAYWISQSNFGLKMLMNLVRFPRNWLLRLNRLFQASDVDLNTKFGADMSALKNIQYFKKISFVKWREVISFINNFDGHDYCLKIINPTLIISGNKDVLMPPKLGRELNLLISNSKFVVSDGLHFDVLSGVGLKALEEFI